MPRTVRKPKEITKRLKPLDFVHEPNGRRSPLIPNEDADSKESSSDCRPVRKKRLSNNDTTKWIFADGMTADSKPTGPRKRVTRASNPRRGRNELSAITEESTSSRKPATKSRTRVAKLAGLPVDEAEKPKKMPRNLPKSTRVGLDSKRQQTAQDDQPAASTETTEIGRHIEQNTAPAEFNVASPVPPSPIRITRQSVDAERRSTPALTSYFRITKKAQEPPTKKPGNAGRMVFRHFLDTISSGSDDDTKDLKPSKRLLVLDSSAEILAPDSPPDECELSNPARRLLAAEKRERTAKKKRLAEKM